MQPIFTLPMVVRDYECDIQGIVNNAVYQNYNEHCRSSFISSLGIEFAELHDRGLDVVVAQLNMRFKVPLRPGDKFEVRLALEKQGLRYVFHQDIVRLVDKKRAEKDPSYQKEVLSLRAQTDIVAIINGRLSDCPELNEKFGL